jgi:lysozyme family protein
MQVARAFYEDTYWVGICGNLITDQSVASKVFDMSVNQGIKEAATLFQRVVYGVPAGGFTTDIDSKIGLNTVSHANAMITKDLIIGLIDHWQWFITQELRHKPQDIAYEKNWRARANKIPSE